MSELKNCPICGETGGWVTSQESSDGTTFIVGCKHCSCQVRVSINNPEYGAKLWNTRTAAPRFTAEEREAIDNLIIESECAVNANCNACPREDKCPTREYDGITIESIATVRAMLTEADKGKG